LVWKAKTEWYFEGEKSNKYHLKGKNTKNEMAKLDTENGPIINPRQINLLVYEYYSKLYNNVQHDDSFLSEIFQVEEHESALAYFVDDDVEKKV